MTPGDDMVPAQQGYETGEPLVGALLPVWSFGDNPSGALDEGPLIAGDRVLFVAGGQLQALDMYTGAPVTPQAPAGAERYPLTVDQRGKVLPCADGGAVYWMNGKTLNASRLADGAPLWTRPNVGRMTALLAVGGRVICVSTSGGTTSVSGYDSRDGTPVFAPVSRATG
ncbi:MAG: hypothetical protein QOD63_2248, partial [Actinomycetota bacterium]|nr:hypothetical protein [Actinomycetota bacterium]